jgi:CheY-like chemotaxis protein
LLFEARAYDLMLTDIMLPDGNGIGIADAARERGIASVVVTGHAFQLPAEELAC